MEATGTDYLFGGTGNDTLWGYTENDYLYGEAGNDSLYGESGNDYLSGSTGNDYLNGGTGNDTLFGGDHGDSFIFDTALGSTNEDTISDFYWFDGDKIHLDNDVFTSLGYTGALSNVNFKFGVATDSNDYILYNSTTNSLYYDADGNGGGAAVKFATVNFTGDDDDLNFIDFTVIA